MADPLPKPEAYPRLRRWWDGRRALRSMPRGRWWAMGIAVLAVFFLVGLPFLLPLGGPATRHPATLADANGAFIDIDGVTLYYTHIAGSGQPVIFLHGLGGSTVSWSETMPVLARAGYDVYAVDLAGFGLSEKGWRADYSHPAQAARIVGWMDALGIERAVIVGHSMGGNVAAHLALAYPERVDRLVLVAAAILGESQTPAIPDILFDLPFTRRWAQLILRRGATPMFEDIFYDAVGDDSTVSPELVEGYRRVLKTPDWDLALLGIVRDADRNDLPAPVSDIQVPTLILWGADDGWVSPEDGTRLAQLIPGAKRIEFPGVGHLPMHENPGAFQAALLDFLAEEG
jgi:pimeloyl-ACP methyl ester carboxylesterase